MDKPTKYMLIEHMEEFLYEWCKDEYLQVLKYMEHSPECKMVLSNFQSISQFKSDNQQDQEDNQNHLKTLMHANQAQHNNFHLVDQPLNHQDHFQKEGSLQMTTQTGQPLHFDTNRVCLLDLRATQILSPADHDQFDLFVFGGILGDHPPRDRTKQLRNPIFTLRHLDSMQFSTDTALLVTKLIIENQRPFHTLPFIDEPSVSGPTQDHNTKMEFQLEGFRYLKDVYDPAHNDIDPTKDTSDFLMNKNIREQMLTKDLDFHLM